MKKLMLVALAAVMVAGCSENKPESTEAERFGYKGHDLEDPDDMMFFSTDPGVTNWVPARVLTVREMYDYSSNELALVAAAGIITPSATFAEIPSDFKMKSKEPWFTTWSKEVEAFGKQGVCGFISHYNEARKLWETAENYFSTYYDSEAESVTALAALEPEIAKFAPLKFHRFDKCWVAEFLRLRVMGLAGRRPDGKWTCMLSINDKCNPGCGPWEPEAAQQERVDDIAFKAELKAWREAVDVKVKANHVAVVAQAKEAGIPLFGPEVEPQSTGDGRMVYFRCGVFPMSNAVHQVAWDERAQELEKASAAKLGKVQRQEYGPFVVWNAEGTNRLFSARLDMAFPKPSTNAVENASAVGEWRQLCFENTLPGFELPPQPKRKR